MESLVVTYKIKRKQNWEIEKAIHTWRDYWYWTKKILTMLKTQNHEKKKAPAFHKQYRIGMLKQDQFYRIELFFLYTLCPASKF